ncbi:MAG: hypothetical protein AVO33_10765 [delta proteobacterium ML8_F1]|nr:MAG: hypothetical protein AVO33_10765 [delta proteobacterium ML8_F1]
MLENLSSRLLGFLSPYTSYFYYVGGVTRDHLLGFTTRDIDVVAPISFAAMRHLHASLKDEALNQLHFIEGFSNIRFELEGNHIDLVPLRKESYKPQSPYPEVSEGSFMEDALRRDFTVNAIYLKVSRGSAPKWIDPFNGIKDLEDSLLKTIREEAFDEDPTRIIRLYIYHYRYQFRIDAKTLDLARSATYGKLQPGLLLKYLQKVLDEKNPLLLNQLIHMGVFKGIGIHRCLAPATSAAGEELLLELFKANPGALAGFEEHKLYRLLTQASKGGT